MDTVSCVFVSITNGGDRGLYASNDLSNWVKVADGTYRLSESIDRRRVLATDELQPDKSLLLDVATQKSVAVPGSVLRAVGSFEEDAPIIFYDTGRGTGYVRSPQFTRQSLLDQAEWTLPTLTASLAASPDFATRGFAIAGGFRTGIYRTFSAGRVCEPVLDDPSQIVPGSGEIIGVAILSPTTVIAVNGGRLAWFDF